MTREELIAEIQKLEEATNNALKKRDIKRLAEVDKEYCNMYVNVADFFEKSENRCEIFAVLTAWNTLVRTNGKILSSLQGTELAEFFRRTRF